MIAHDIIIRPIITEKSMMGIAEKKYTFEVAKTATKIDIANAVEEAFKAEDESVDSIEDIVEAVEGDNDNTDAE